MFKFMKYEIRGTYRFMLALIATVLFASTGIQLYAFNSMRRFNLEGSQIGAMENGLLVIIMVFMIFGAFITAFFYIVGSFRKELYEDRGYLTFSLPLTGKQIVGSKLIIALFWSAILGLSALVYNLVLGVVLFGDKWTGGFKYIFSMIPGNLVVSIGITGLFSSITTLLLIYFSMTISRVSIRNKRIGGLWFIIFLVLNALVTFITIKASSILPYYFDLTSFKFMSQSAFVEYTRWNTSNIISIVNGGGNGSMVLNSAGKLIFNIGSTLASLSIVLGTFFGTSYLIENKIDL